MIPQVVSFNCVLKNKVGKIISTTFNREVLTATNSNQTGMLSGLSKNLKNLKKGDKRSIRLSAEEAYGLYYPNKVILYPRHKLPDDTKPGQTVTIVTKNGVHNTFIVLEFFRNFVRLDGNHPLAGQDLIFEIETLEARDATHDEIEDSLCVPQFHLIH